MVFLVGLWMKRICVTIRTSVRGVIQTRRPEEKKSKGSDFVCSLVYGLSRGALNEGNLCYSQYEPLFLGWYKLDAEKKEKKSKGSGLMCSLASELEEDLYWIVPHVYPTTQSVKGLNCTELTWQASALGFWWGFQGSLTAFVTQDTNIHSEGDLGQQL